MARIKALVRPFLDFEGDNPALLVDNLDWTAPMSALDFLRDVGKHFRVNQMIRKDAVAARLESQEGISYTEFSYQLLQALDYLHLYREFGCTLQTGGSDQWGNLTAGVDLIHRVTGSSVHALTTPLLVDAAGAKFGKSEGNADLALGRHDQSVRLPPVLPQHRGRFGGSGCCGCSATGAATRSTSWSRRPPRASPGRAGPTGAGRGRDHAGARRRRRRSVSSRRRPRCSAEGS